MQLEQVKKGMTVKIKSGEMYGAAGDVREVTEEGAKVHIEGVVNGENYIGDFEFTADQLDFFP